MLWHALQSLCRSPSITHVFIVVSEGDGYVDALMRELPEAIADKLTVLPVGGATRQASVSNGLAAIAEKVSPNDWVLVHDAARPGLTVELTERLIAALRTDEVGGLLALQVVDTLKRTDTGGRVAQTLSREGMWMAQTPQMFRAGLLRKALDHADALGVEVTDESSAIEALGLAPKLVEGAARNFKVTLPRDIALAERYLSSGLADD